MGTEVGVREGGGVGGGNGWSRGAPYGLCRPPGEFSGGAVGIDGEMGGIISGEEDERGGGPKNVEGFTRSVERLAALFGSELSRMDIKGVETDRLDGVWAVVKVGRATAWGWDVEITVAEDWYCCPGIAAFGAPPIFIAVWE